MNPYACAVDGCKCRKLYADDDYCSGHLLGFLCICNRTKMPRQDLCARCEAENVPEPATTAPPALRLLPGGLK